MRRLLPLILVAGLAACGGAERDPAAPGQPASAAVREKVATATRSTAADFPAVDGRTLQEVADGIGATGPQAVMATTNFVPGTNRLAFGVLDDDNRILYGKTAVYLARDPGSRATGPFPAPADSLITDGRYRSRTAATESDPIAAIYNASVPFDRPGGWYVLVATEVEGRLLAATAKVKVLSKRSDPVAAVGEPAPRVATETVASARGDIESIDTRVPPSDMHGTSFKDVVGKKPVALLFATPQLCASRVCGPVVDIAQQLKSKYGRRMEFIHQEVFVDNEAGGELRPPLKAFGLPTEPWLFTVDREGRIAARLEGSFGFNAFDSAIRAAL
jgi:hypothetical protein